MSSWKETLEIMIDELEDKKPLLTLQGQRTLALYYELLAKDWHERHYCEDSRYCSDKKKPSNETTDTG